MIIKDVPTASVLSVLKGAPVQTNAGKMSARVVLTTEDDDRSNDRVIVKGINLSHHRLNPVALLNHNKDLPIGRFEDRTTKAYTVHVRNDRELVGEIYFNQSSEFAHDVFRAVENKIFTACSIGFLPTGRIEKRHDRGHIYHGSNLVEGSVVVIGDNQHALVEFVEKEVGGRTICKQLSDVLLPMITSRPVTVVGGWESEEIEKAGTYKTAEAKEVEPLTRSSTYYVCPHCSKEISAEHIHKDEDGRTRHGECRGEIILKQPEHVGEIGTHPTAPPSVANHVIHGVPKSLRYTHKPKRFLPGLRTKAMPPTYDDPNAVAPADDAGGFVDPLDDPEEQGSGMKSGAEAHHGVNDILMQALAFIEDSQGTVDNATAKKTLEKVSKWISKAMQALHAGHEAYLGEHPDQPELPGAEGIGPGDGDEDEDGTDDFEDDDDGLDSDGDGEDEDGELEDDMDDSAGGEKKPKKKKKGKPFGDKEEKAAREWRTKAVDAYWESLKRDAVKGDAEVITKAIADLKGDMAFEKRMAVKGVVKSLEGLVTKEAKPEPAAVVADRLSDDWYDEENAAKNGTL